MIYANDYVFLGMLRYYINGGWGLQNSDNSE